jgi:hypothetical protein
MIIDFYFDQRNLKFDTVVVSKIYSGCNTELVVSNIHSNSQYHRFEFDLLQLEPQIIKVEFSVDDPTIIDNPLTVTNIVLDDFYSFSKLKHAGTSIFDNWFCNHASVCGITLDHNITDSNCLNYTGKLIYNITWPFFRNMWQ